MSPSPGPSPFPVLLGVDGGGSKTLALAADLQGHVLGRGLAGPSNYHAVGLEAATAALETAIVAALEATQLPSAAISIAALCLGLAGMGRPEDRAVMQTWAAERFPGATVAVVTDAQLVLAAGTPAGWGLALISGTGSLAYGEDAAGHNARAGGWGYLLGDEGSGYAIGLAALRAIARAADGRGPQTALTAAVLAQWGLSQPQDLIRHVYRPELGRSEIAALAALVEAAAAHDAVAHAIIQEAGRELALMVQTVARQLAFSGAVPCAVAGSVLVKGPAVVTAFRAAAVEWGLRLEPFTPVAEPAWGAIRLARATAVVPQRDRSWLSR